MSRFLAKLLKTLMTKEMLFKVADYAWPYFIAWLKDNAKTTETKLDDAGVVAVDEAYKTFRRVM